MLETVAFFGLITVILIAVKTVNSALFQPRNLTQVQIDAIREELRKDEKLRIEFFLKGKTKEDVKTQQALNTYYSHNNHSNKK